MATIEELRAVMNRALSVSEEEADAAVERVLATEPTADVTPLLNELLVAPGHTSHQLVARALQEVRSPSTIPFVKRAIDGGFGYLDYTCSEPEVLAKWFSWILASIGTPESIDLIRSYSASKEAWLREEMCYRLKRVS